jgi:hypothetical protein
MHEDSMEMDEFKGKPDSMPLMTSKNWSKMPRSESTDCQRLAQSGVTIGNGASGLAKEGTVFCTLAAGANVGLISTGGVGTSIASIEVEANAGSANQRQDSVGILGDKKLLPIDLGSSLAGVSPMALATTGNISKSSPELGN